MLRGWVKYLPSGMMALLLTAALVPFANAATNAVTGGIGGLDNGTLRGGDGTGPARIVLNAAGSVVVPGNCTVTINPVSVPADGVTVSTITVVLLDADNQPVSGKTVVITSDRGPVDTIAQPPVPTDGTGTAVGTIRSSIVGSATITATDQTDGIVLPPRPRVTFTQGQVLDLVKTANKKRAVPGDIVTYLVEIRNLTSGEVHQVSIDDRIPPNFRYVSGSARLTGVPIPDPVGNRPMTFNLGTIPALTDSNGNGVADPGEAGYEALTYQLIIGSGAEPGDYVNAVAAWDADPSTLISNDDDAVVTVTPDPLFDLSLIHI